jgi:hypothetical protein
VRCARNARGHHARDAGDEHRASALDIEEEWRRVRAAHEDRAVLVLDLRVLDEHGRRLVDERGDGAAKAARDTVECGRTGLRG